jgi:hypothetical protein
MVVELAFRYHITISQDDTVEGFGALDLANVG